MEMIKFVREGDIIHVHDLSRLGRNIKELRNLIDELINKGVTVKFHKVDGSVRKMNCRTGVHKFLKGGDLSYRPVDKPNLRVVFDVKSNGYRTINLDKVFYIKAGRKASITWLTPQLLKNITSPK